MEDIFKGYFYPTADEFSETLKNCIFAFDANVILNLYRYSDSTRKKLEQSLEALKDRIFLPHQAAKEFLRNRHNVIASQANSYQTAATEFNKISDIITNTSKHPYLDNDLLQKFTEIRAKIIQQLDEKREQLSNKINTDTNIEKIKSLFQECTGSPFDEKAAGDLRTEGERRYKAQIPPGWKDKDKEPNGDINRKFGDLFIWKQLIEKSKVSKRPLILVSEDKKEDWWQDQSGRTIGPQPELVSEFFAETQQAFWMYTADQFLERTADITRVNISADVIDEIKSVTAARSKQNFSEFLRLGTALADSNISEGRKLILLEIAKRLDPFSLINLSYEEAKARFTDITGSIHPGALTALRGTDLVNNTNELTPEGWNLLAAAAVAIISSSTTASSYSPNLFNWR